MNKQFCDICGEEIKAKTINSTDWFFYLSSAIEPTFNTAWPRPTDDKVFVRIGYSALPGKHACIDCCLKAFKDGNPPAQQRIIT